MFKLKYLVVFILLAIGITMYSCSNEKANANEGTVSAKEMQDTVDDKDLKNPVVGYISEDNEPVLTKNSKLLLNNWNKNVLGLSKIDAKFDAIALIKIEEDYYLRATSSETVYVSTIGAFVDQRKIYLTSTSCTTTLCASSDRCIPKGTSCTPCFSDCTKTVTSEVVAPYIGVYLASELLAEYYIRKGWEGEIYWEYKRQR